MTPLLEFFGTLTSGFCLGVLYVLVLQWWIDKKARVRK